MLFRGRSAGHSVMVPWRIRVCPLSPRVTGHRTRPGHLVGRSTISIQQPQQAFRLVGRSAAEDFSGRGVVPTCSVSPHPRTGARPSSVCCSAWRTLPGTRHRPIGSRPCAIAAETGRTTGRGTTSAAPSAIRPVPVTGSPWCRSPTTCVISRRPTIRGWCSTVTEQLNILAPDLIRYDTLG